MNFNKDDLSISLLKDREDYEMTLKYEPNEILPDIKPHTIISIIGTTNSGKSVLINNLVYKFYYDLFDIIVLISPSAQNDRSMASFRLDPKVIIFEEYDDRIINELEELQKVEDDTEYKNQNRMLIIFDDCANPRGCSKYDSAISLLATRHRHSAITIMFSIQLYKQLSHSIRSNTKAFIIKNTPNKNELNKMAEELGFCCGGKQNFFRLYNKALKDNRYNFLYLDLKKGIAYKNFEEKLYSMDEDNNLHLDK
jgi:hypothetical protein